ncbi:MULTISPECIES: LLM class oxidoreductase [Burkholderia]|uniref:LLM class oxidoreductase n=1 Tax=Burkholderia anthina TaxID=179879 RepID=A0A7T7AL56_9BURK|nr:MULTISPECIES: LLM class oxidoreductase [Burkholderia]QQK06543.1 LLM class oxidoreductase [Burkholderia anthina]
MPLPTPDRAGVAQRVFPAGRLSIGLTLPLLRGGNTVADFNEQIELAALADTLGFRALWIRDVPLNNADYPDPVGHLDPWVLLGALASRTRRIVLASGAIVLPLRHPLHIAKGALSVAALSGSRFILGLGSGDRPPEYAAFGVDAETRRDRYRRHWDIVATALGMPSRVLPDEAPPDAPEFTLLPRGDDAVPMLAVGSGGQSVDWIARNSIGWMTYHRDPDTQRARHSMWRAAVDRLPQPAFRAFGVSMRLDLASNRDAPATALPLGYATGRHALIDILRDMRAAGTHHVTLNPGSDRPVREIIEEIAGHVLPIFHDDHG